MSESTEQDRAASAIAAIAESFECQWPLLPESTVRVGYKEWQEVLAEHMALQARVAELEKERDELRRQVVCDSDPDVRHWFCFSFIGTLKGGGHSANASIYVGYRCPKITKAMIDEQKQQAGLKSDAVLLSITPLGKMTKAQFAGDDQENQIEGGA